MTITRQTATVLELTFQDVTARINVFRGIGVVAPVIGIVILVSRMEAIGLILGLIFLFPLYSLFTSITERCVFDKAKNTITFFKARPLGEITRTYSIYELESVDVIKDSGWRYICFYFRSNKREQQCRVKMRTCLSIVYAKYKHFFHVDSGFLREEPFSSYPPHNW